MSESISIAYKSYAPENIPSITAFSDWQGNMHEIFEQDCQIEMQMADGDKELVCKLPILGDYYISYIKTDHSLWQTAIQVYGPEYYKIKAVIQKIEKRLIFEKNVIFLNYIANEFNFEEKNLMMTVKITPKKTLCHHY